MSEKAKALRAELKEAGYNGKSVTVRHKYFSMGSEIIVTVRNPDILRADVKKIASGYEKIDRCEYSGEILSGGNTYLSVRYSDEALETRKNRVLPSVNISLERIKGYGEGSTVAEPTGDCLIGFDRGGRFIRVWREDHMIGQAYNDQYAADHIAQIMVN